MQFVPVNRAPSLEKKDDTEISSVYAARPAKTADARHVAPFPLEFKPVERRTLSAPPVLPEEKPTVDFQERSIEERRKYCRRLQNQPILYNLRAGPDRRRKNQRKGDLTTAIDEIA